jgi:hypothetical protein
VQRHPAAQVIAVESPVRDHARDDLAVVEAGKHLHREKASADTMADLGTHRANRARQAVGLQVGYMWRYHPGSGGYPFAAVLRRLKEVVYRGWVSVEVFDFRPDGFTVAGKLASVCEASRLDRLKPILA